VLDFRLDWTPPGSQPAEDMLKVVGSFTPLSEPIPDR
jgi:hypothetical protein